jgi:Cys-tRNA(Pro)/Cys-tRNA(Cys) deacylase
MAQGTPATMALRAAGIGFELREYVYEHDVERVGLHAAAALGEPASRVLKTLIAEVDGKPVCLVLASDREASMKKVALARGGRRAAMLSPAVAERLTGYRVGGVSPFGQKRRLPTVVDAAAMTESLVYVNGGRRGLQVRLAPVDLCAATGAEVHPIAG